MSLFLRPRVFEFTQTTGTGTLQLTGAASSSYRSFLTAFGANNQCYYTVYDGSGGWEYGLGTINASSQLARTMVIDSSNAGAALNLAAGTKTVICAIPPEACVNIGVVNVTDNATSFSVKNGRVFRFNNSGTPTVTALTNGIDGQEILLVNIGGNNTTIQAGTNLRLNGGANRTLGTHDTLHLIFFIATWYEVAFSNNA